MPMAGEAESPQFHTITSTHLLEGLRSRGNNTIWNQFVERYRPMIVRYARRFGLSDAAEPGRRIFEAAAIPIGVAAVVMATGVELGPAVLKAILGELAEWSSIGRHLLAISESFLAAVVVAGVVSVNRCASKAIGQLFGAGFLLFGLRMGLGFAVPWMTSW